MTEMAVASLVASVASLVLAVIAIWLSIVFYRMSSQLSDSTREAAKGIGSSVERLEKLFDKLYADTFSMMRDTVSDMRKHIWPEDAHAEDKVTEEAEKKADQKVQALKEEVQKQLSELLKGLKITDDRISGMTHELSDIMDRVINQSRRVEIEAMEETIRQHVMRTFHSLRGKRPFVEAGDLVARLSETFSGIRVIEEIERMKADGQLFFEGKHLVPESAIWTTNEEWLQQGGAPDRR